MEGLRVGGLKSPSTSLSPNPGEPTTKQMRETNGTKDAKNEVSIKVRRELSRATDAENRIIPATKVSCVSVSVLERRVLVSSSYPLHPFRPISLREI